jgi:signal transduction histidine kinase
VVTTKTKRILIADDNPTNVILLDRLLRQMQYETSHAYSGQEVIDKLEIMNFDLLLLDVMMPDVTGFVVLEWIRARYSLDALPVIMVSALTDDEDVIKGLDLGANDYVTKPVQVDILQRRVETQLKIKQMADERNYIQQRLTETNELQNRLMRIASHDLKNPLANISLVLELLQNELEDKSLINMATDQVKKMVGIIHEFLELELIRNNTIKVNCVPTHYADTLKSVIVAFQQAAAAKGITIDVDLSDQLVLADKNRLEQALSNLVSNAIKYAQFDSTVNIWDEQDGDELIFFIRNTGESISIDEKDKLFQPFGKLRARPTAGEHSSGLGLWIVQQMMQAQNGDVGLDWDYSDGACFWIRLPICDGSEAETQPAYEGDFSEA